MRVADPRQVTFLCSRKEKCTKRKRSPDVALFLRFAPLPSSSSTVHPCTGDGARSPDRAPSGWRAKACDARGRHTGLNVKPKHQTHPAQFAALIAPYALSLFRRYGFDCRREQRLSRCINRPVFYFGARRVFAKKVIAFPVLRWPDWSGSKTTTTIWTYIAQNLVDTRGAERTLISTDARLR